jgi:hypothetical protein
MAQFQGYLQPSPIVSGKRLTGIWMGKNPDCLALKRVETRRAREGSGQFSECIAPSLGIFMMRIMSRDNIRTNRN